MVAFPSPSVPKKAIAQLLFLCAFLGPLAFVSCARAPDAAALLAAGDVPGALREIRKEFAAGDTSVRTRYNLGSALLASDSLPPATELLENIRRASDGEIRMRSRFNAGLGELKQICNVDDPF